VLVAFNKPHGVLCQFTDRSTPPRPTLAGFGLPPGVYPAGRLDHDSEGLLLLTDDGALVHRITDPRRDGPTRPARVRLLDAAPPLWPRDPPVRVRKTVPDAWLELAISEGRNRQVRRMTAAVGLPTLRLVRVAIGGAALESLVPGTWREVPHAAPFA
jgi:23S rRNA pseudouridine2457 synthase